MIIVADSSTLIGMALSKKFTLLKELFKVIYIPSQVYVEVVEEGKGKVGEKEVKEADWIQVKKAKDIKSLANLRRILSGLGESEVIVLAEELQADLVLFDEPKARAIARRKGLKVLGIASIFVLAKKKGLISSVKEVLLTLKAQGFYLNEEILNEALREAEEL